MAIDSIVLESRVAPKQDKGEKSTADESYKQIKIN